MTEPTQSLCPLCKGRHYIIHEDVASPCQCLVEAREIKAKDIRLTKSNLPRLIGANLAPSLFEFNTYQGNLSVSSFHSVQALANKPLPYCAYLYGANSTQKSTTAQALGRVLVGQGKDVYYVLMNELVRSLTQEGFARSGEENDEIKAFNKMLYSIPYLIIDESFDAQKVTMYQSGYQLAFLDTFLRKRMEGLPLATIFVSNVNPEGIDVSVFRPSIKELVIRKTHGRVYEFRDKFNPDSVVVIHHARRIKRHD